MLDSPSKKTLITSPAFAGCFTLFSLLCTAFFVLSDRTSFSTWPSSFSLLFRNDSAVATFSNAHFGGIADLGAGSNGSVPGGKDSLLNPKDQSVKNESLEDGHFGETVSLLDQKDGHFSENGDLGRGSNGSVPGGKDSLSSTINGTENRERVKDGYLGGSANLSNPRDQSVKSFEDGHLGGSVSLLDKKDGHFGGNGDLGSVSNGSVLSGKDGKMRERDSLSNPMNTTVNSESLRGEMVDRRNGGSDKKDGQTRENYNKTVMDSWVMVSNSSILSNSSSSLLLNGTIKGGTVEDRRKEDLSNRTMTDKQVKVSNSSIPSKKDEHFGESNSSSDPMNQTVNGESVKVKTENQRKENLWEKMIGCDFFDGSWVEDDTYPLYKPGSCPHIDEPFDCYRNGRPDNGYEKFRWQPKGCNIPRLNGRDMLEMLRGKRLVYVGDSLNRNMWESMVCTLRNAVKDKRKVFEASGKRDFRTEHSYSFVFLDYNCSVEFFRTTFLVQEWDMPDTDGLKKETLRLDMVARSFDRFKNADILVFNTGHWWTHEKTALGKGYYQEGSHVYDELNVLEAFRRAMTTWGRWLDENIDPKKTLVVFRGYSQSHFSGGQWNSGGQCDSETVPIKNETYLKGYPSKMSMLERVMSGMRTPVLLLNVSKMTDFRKDAHPSIYRSQHLTEEERKSPLRFQDCSHWCLPGVPETWNELLYAQIFTKYKQQEKEKQQRNRQ